MTACKLRLTDCGYCVLLCGPCPRHCPYTREQVAEEWERLNAEAQEMTARTAEIDVEEWI